MMENKMETIIVYWGNIGENGKESGNYYSGFRVEILTYTSLYNTRFYFISLFWILHYRGS